MGAGDFVLFRNSPRERRQPLWNIRPALLPNIVVVASVAIRMAAEAGAVISVDQSPAALRILPYKMIEDRLVSAQRIGLIFRIQVANRTPLANAYVNMLAADDSK